ncbi:hypothetical protein [Streptomyces sp. Amel2xC10]|uniref:hypothetical protein n=1 Tax=Streptomyces sp. Amel2xC10 TaxID=1305826 RepID=UPI000A09087D|nr:hypothetical protein [Streptomyces sp. Amel2xC10]SMF86682.1 hypothetical protein SAMN02745830_07201 [Streptomyces sp. Amel2xC10]
MPDLPFPGPAAERAPFDLDEANKTLASATIGYVELTLRRPGTPPDKQQATDLMVKIQKALLAGSHACAEVTRIRTELAALRDTHRPQPHADPTKPGALCAACSLHGSIVSWPCAAWTAAEQLLTHGKA